MKLGAIAGRLASVKLTLSLLALLAAAAAVGTLGVIPQGLPESVYGDRYGFIGSLITGLGLDRFHYSIPYRLLFILFLANLLACCATRSIVGLKAAFARGEPALRVPLKDPSAAREALAEAGFEVVTGEGPLIAKRRLWAFSAFALVHLSPVLVALGAFLGTEAGFIGTTNVHVGSIADTVRAWRDGEEVSLPFAVEVKGFKRYWFPLTARFAAKTADGSALEPLELTEGAEAAIPGTAYSILVERFDPDAAEIRYRVAGGGFSGTFTRANMASAPVMLSPLAFRGEVRRAEAEVAIYGKDSQLLVKSPIAVNEPVRVLGHTVFLTAWGADSENKPFVGLQVAYDPAQWIMWVGAILFTLGVCVLLFVEGAWVREEGGELVGRASRNRRDFAELLARAAKGSG